VIQEWRPIPGFAGRYEITENGEIRDKLYFTTVRANTNGYVWLWKGDKRHQRSVAKLIRLAYSERQYPVLDVEGFRPARGIPGYSINRKGEIFNERFRKFLIVNADGSVQVQIDGRRVHRTVKSLIRETFGE
jgi:hypothetical protein